MPFRLTILAAFAAGVIATLTYQDLTRREDAQRAEQSRAAASSVSVLQRAQAAVAYWNRKAEADPHDHISRRNLADAYLALARASGDEAPFALAEAALRESLRLFPTRNTGAKGRLARVLMGSHKFGEALDLVCEARAEAPDEEWLLAVEVDALDGLGRYDDARRVLGAFAQREDGFSVWSRQARLSELFGRDHDTLELWRRCRESYAGVDAEPLAWAHLMTGVHYLKRNQLEEAQRWFEATIEVAPDYYLAHEHLAEVYEIRGDLDAARPHLLRSIELQRAPELLERLAAIEEARGRHAEAEALDAEAFAAIQADYARNPTGHARALSEALLDRDLEPERALALAREDFALRQDLDGHRALARALAANGELEEAREVLRRGLAWDAFAPALTEYAAELGVR